MAVPDARSPVAANAGVGAPVRDVDPGSVGLARSRTFVPELESVRGIAILQVVVMHTDSAIGRHPPPALSILRALIRADRLGIDLFLLLSGFLLSGPFLAAAAGRRRVSIREYFARRALRILPLYWTAVIVASVLSATRPADLLHGLPYLAFLNSFPDLATPLPPYSSVWWSLATEVQFYLVLPIFGLLLLSRPGRVVATALFMAYVLAYVTYLLGRWHAQTLIGIFTLQSSLFGRAPLFLAGIGAAELYRRYGSRARAWLAGAPWAWNGGADLAFLLLVVLVNFQTWQFVGAPERHYPEYQYRDVVDALMLVTGLLMLLLAPLRLKPLLVNPVLGRLGVLSYSIYLIHLPLLFLWAELRAWLLGPGGGWTLGTTAVMATYPVALIALASLTYRYIEAPFLRYKSHLAR